MNREVPPAPCRLRIAASFFARLCGLLFARAPGSCLLIVPCHDVHTWGMRFPLDVAFIDGAGRVLEVHRGVGAGKRLRNEGAKAVFERFAQPGAWFQAGDLLTLACMREGKR